MVVTSGADETTAAGFWEGFYRGREPRAGVVNPVLAQEAADLAPGTALDLGSGEGGDAIWLAGRRWTVTAVDVSGTALRRAASRADAAGLAGRITWSRHDLASSFPSGDFDLVSTHYLHSPVELPTERVLGRAAAAVAPGGTLLVVGHAEAPPWAFDHGPSVRFSPLRRS